MSVFDALSSIPCEITSGEGESWVETDTDYPGATHSIAYKFGGMTPLDGWQTFAIAGTESDTATYTFTMPTSPAPKPGRYQWERQVTLTASTSMRVTDRGCLTVLPNLATAQTVTAEAAQLAALDIAILAISASTDQSVSFNGQSVTKSDLTRLQSQRVALQAAVYRQQQALAALSGNARGGTIAVRFGPSYRCGC